MKQLIKLNHKKHGVFDAFGINKDEFKEKLRKLHGKEFPTKSQMIEYIWNHESFESINEQILAVIIFVEMKMERDKEEDTSDLAIGFAKHIKSCAEFFIKEQKG